MTEDSLFANYKRAPVAFSHGDGVFLWDRQGREYLDFLGGIAVSSLGHNHPALSDAINRQARRYLHVSNLYRIPEQERAGRKLVEATGGVLDRAFFLQQRRGGGRSGDQAGAALRLRPRRFG